MSYQPYDIQSILKPLSSNEINVYSLLDGFVSYLIETGLTSKSIHLYLASVRSYLSYFDIEIVPSKFHRRVKMPRHHREPEQPLDASNIRDILLVCSNRRLKAYLLTLASGGMRATEALAIRLKDIDFSSSPTKIHLRKEFSKTRTARDIFISQEATAYLKEWLTWKYRDKSLDRSNPDRNRLKTYTKNPNDLVFTAYNTANANNLYHEISTEFSKLLSSERVRLDERKEEGRQKRRKITLHSLRRFTKSVISNQVNSDFSEWFLGHNNSPYYTIKDTERRRIYSTVEKYLTFLDYDRLEVAERNIEDQLKLKDEEITSLRRKVREYDEFKSETQNELSSMKNMIRRVESLVGKASVTAVEMEEQHKKKIDEVVLTAESKIMAEKLRGNKGTRRAREEDAVTV